MKSGQSNIISPRKDLNVSKLKKSPIIKNATVKQSVENIPSLSKTSIIMMDEN
jgi:hypothetical protein